MVSIKTIREAVYNISENLNVDDLKGLKKVTVKGLKLQSDKIAILTDELIEPGDYVTTLKKLKQSNEIYKILNARLSAIDARIEEKTGQKEEAEEEEGEDEEFEYTVPKEPSSVMFM